MLLSNDMLLEDRLMVIRQIYSKYDLENNAYISFSGGKDSTILHFLFDIAIPDNRIPRVFIDTGIEYNMIRSFVLDMANKDNRFVIIKPSKPIKTILDKWGYPFKSKEHSLKIGEWQKGFRSNYLLRYKAGGPFGCPKMLFYQFEDSFKIKLSNQCCYKLKKGPVRFWEKSNKRSIVITGMRKAEGGQRANIKGCVLTDNLGHLKKFHPLLVVSDSWEDWFIRFHHIKLCGLYYPPFNFKRTGCKGCPYSLDLQEQLIKMARYLPVERKQCEFIWQPIYSEYRRLNYRLSPNEQICLF